MSSSLMIGLTPDFLNADRKLAYEDIGLDLVEATGGKVGYRFLEELPAEIRPEQLEGLDFLFVDEPSVTANTLRDSGRLRAVARFGVGYDNVDVAACTQEDVALINTPGAPSTPVAEGIACLMLAITHRLLIKDRLVRQDRWDLRYDYMGSELRDRVVGVVGPGRIGKRALEVLSGFGMAPAIAYHPRRDQAALAGMGMKKVDLDTLLKTADFVLVTCSLNETSRGMIGARELALMRPDAYLINVARGAVVDEGALFRCLKEERIAGAALDVFSAEPVDDTVPPFRELDNVILTPHAIAITNEGVRDMGRMAFRSMLDLAEGVKPHGLVNEEVWERPGFQQKLAASS